MTKGWIGAGMALALSIVGANAAISADAAPSGADVYAAKCAGCHGSALEGSNGPAIGPALKGSAFVAKWSHVAPADFLAFVHATMPANQPGALDKASSAAAANHVLAANRLALGDAPRDGSKPLGNAEDDVRRALSREPDPQFKAAMAARAALPQRLTPVSDADLAAPDGKDWLAWRGNAATQGYSPLSQIDRGNAGRVGLAWSLSLLPGTNGIAPLVRDGIMFINTSGTVQALDARSGELIWKFDRPAETSRVPHSQPRGMALYGDALYVPTIDMHIVALDAKTGRVLWDHEIANPADRLQLTAAPLAVRGKIIQGVAGCQGSEFGGGCYIVALDAKTGAEAWRFHSIARPGTPGGDSWNGAPWDKRYGGSVWSTGSYDPATGLAYFGVAQTYDIATLLDPQGRKGKSNDALFTNATVALDPDTGKLAWHFQHVAGDVWDMDWAFERTLATIDGPKGPRRVLITGGKIGIFDVVDAKTGAYLWSYDMGFQNLVAAIDPKTGRKTYDPKLMPEFDKPKFTCPSPIGIRNWMATAYDPVGQRLYMPAMPNCMDYSRSHKAGGSGSFRNIAVGMRRPLGDDGQLGLVIALDMKTRQPVWTNRRRAPEASAMLATAGGLVFEGGYDRSFRALDSATGAVLWQTMLPATPHAFPISYMVDGVQYVTVVTGGGTPANSMHSLLAPEFSPSNGARTIMTFAVGGAR